MVSYKRDLSDTKSLKNEGTDLNLDQLSFMYAHSRPALPLRVPSLLALSCSTFQERSVLHFSIDIISFLSVICAYLSIDALLLLHSLSLVFWTLS